MKNLFYLLMLTGSLAITGCASNETSEADAAAMQKSDAPAASGETTTEAPMKKAAAETEAAPATETATTAPSSTGESITFVCTKNSSTRTIRVIYPEDGSKACEVTYEKSTGTQSLWDANNDKSYCEDKAIEFVTKQEGWGWSCNQQ